MIKLTLLHPVQAIPVRSWTFNDERLVKIGRSPDNHVVIYSAVVSRYHAELKNLGDSWEFVNLGTNGTYFNGKQITQIKIVDGLVLHLARSGPKFQINLTPQAVNGHHRSSYSTSQAVAMAAETSSVKTMITSLPSEIISDGCEDDETTAADVKIRK